MDQDLPHWMRLAALLEGLVQQCARIFQRLQSAAAPGILLLDRRGAVMEFVLETVEVIQFAVVAYSDYLGGSFVKEEVLEVALFLMRRYSQCFGSLMS